MPIGSYSKPRLSAIDKLQTTRPSSAFQATPLETTKEVLSKGADVSCRRGASRCRRIGGCERILVALARRPNTPERASIPTPPDLHHTMVSIDTFVQLLRFHPSGLITSSASRPRSRKRVALTTNSGFPRRELNPHQQHDALSQTESRICNAIQENGNELD
jgi:hypothetical protein